MVSQGPILDSELFNIYPYDLDEDMERIFINFARDTKLNRIL